MKKQLLFLMALMFAGASVWAQATIVGGATYPTIQAAITAADAGDVIEVAAGTYPETLNLGAKQLIISGAGLEQTIIDADGISGYAIQNFGDGTTIKDLQLINSQHYGFKVSGASNITLTNILVENSAKTGIDLNGVQAATLTNIEVNNTVGGFGLMIGDSDDIAVDDVATSNNSWGGVTVQSYGRYYAGGCDNIDFLGFFNATDAVPFLIEQDPWVGVYSPITNVDIPDQFNFAVYALRSGPDYKQTAYFETLGDAKIHAEGLATTTSFTYTDIVIYNIEETNYYVIENLSIQTAIDAASAGDVIEVNPGTYQECLTIDKSISILGPNEAISPNTGVRVGEAVIDAGFNYRVLAIDHALDFTSTGITFIMKGMTIDMENAADQSRFANNQSGAENNYTFENNRFLNGVPCTNGNWWFTGTGTTLQFNLLDNYFNNGDVSNGISIWVNGVNNVNVQDNVWEDNKAWAMNFNRVVGTIANNKFIDNDAADPDIIWYNNQNGFIIAACNNDLSIYGNQFTNNYSSINIYENTTGTIDVYENTFENTKSYAIKIRELSSPGDFAFSAYHNQFLNTDIAGFAVINLTEPQISFDANCNWWGTDNGALIPALISGDVDFAPYLLTDDIINPVCHGGRQAYNETTGMFYDTAQEAIDAATEGDEIKVYYNPTEELDVNKELNIHYIFNEPAQ